MTNMQYIVTWVFRETQTVMSARTIRMISVVSHSAQPPHTLMRNQTVTPVMTSVIWNLGEWMTLRKNIYREDTFLEYINVEIIMCSLISQPVVK